MKKNIFLVASIIVLIFIITILGINKYSTRSRLIELNVDDVIEKVNNKESFVLCISRTDCSHCMDYKPKLEKITREYDIEIFYIDIDKYSKEKQTEFIKHVSFDKSTPVTAFIKNGKEVTSSNRILGDVDTDKIIDKLIKNGFIKEK